MLAQIAIPIHEPLIFARWEDQLQPSPKQLTPMHATCVFDKIQFYLLRNLNQVRTLMFLTFKIYELQEAVIASGKN